MKRIRPIGDSQFKIIKPLDESLNSTEVRMFLRTLDADIFDNKEYVTGTLYMNHYHEAGMALFNMNENDYTTYLLTVLGEDDV